MSAIQSFLFDVLTLQIIFSCFLLFLFYVCLLFLKCLTRILAKYQLPELRALTEDGIKPLVVGFFHPYCNAGGGGERVLWSSIRALQLRYSHIRCVVYTGDTEATREEIIQRAQERFNIHLLRTDALSLTFIYLQNRKLVEAQTYPRLTLLGQSLGSILLGFEAMFRLIPDIYIDSMGYAFTFPLFKYLAGCKVACYVHYPTISSDMLQAVADGVDAHNNATLISQSSLLTTVKYWYYRAFAILYGCVGRFSDVVAVNSSWTQQHIATIWKVCPTIIYPPCNVDEFLTIPINDRSLDKTQFIVSVAQFRPEKNHKLQLRSFKRFLSKKLSNFSVEGDGYLHSPEYKLLLIGSSRNEEDDARVEELKQLVKDLNIQDFVEFKLNVPFHDLKQILSESSVGIHTMWNEHFGIGIVECMAAGVIMLAHNSGGPKSDILIEFNNEKTGYLASDEETYAECLSEIFKLTTESRTRIRQNARQSVWRFSDHQFERNFLNLTKVLIA